MAIRYNQVDMIKHPKQLFVRAFIALLVATAVLVPGRAAAFSPADLKTATEKSEALCDSGQYDWACTYAKQYREELTKVEQLSTSKAKQKYIDDNIFKQLKTTTYMDVATAYNKAEKDGKVNTGASKSSGFEGDCNNGGVQISVGVNDNDNCVGGNGVNPIYAYLKNIIIFLGGAIGLAVVITIIVAGIQYSSSNGNPANITKAKERLMNAVIGLVLYLFLAAILRYLVPQIFTS